MPVFEISATRVEGFSGWIDWIRTRVKAKREE
jgi:hypothetical protein